MKGLTQLKFTQAHTLLDHRAVKMLYDSLARYKLIWSTGLIPRAQGLMIYLPRKSQQLTGAILSFVPINHLRPLLPLSQLMFSLSLPSFRSTVRRNPGK